MDYYEDDNKVPKESEKTQQQREFCILEEIKRQPRIHHNALREVIIGRGDMANKTFTKILAELIKEGRVVVERDKNKKRYSIPNTKINSADFTNDIEHGASIVEYHMRRMRKEYSKLYTMDKSMMALFALKSCMNTLRAISLASAFVRKSKHYIATEERIQGCVREITEIVSNDPESDIVLPLVKANMLQDDTLKAMNNVHGILVQGKTSLPSDLIHRNKELP
jgi:hypothetical protein